MAVGRRKKTMSGVRKLGCKTASGAGRSNAALMCGCKLLTTDSLQYVLAGAVMCLAFLLPHH